MVVYYKTEVRFEFHHQRVGWMPMTYKETGESTWEKKDGHWKLVRGTWVQQQRDMINAVTLPARP
jgi:hypothetical protein